MTGPGHPIADPFIRVDVAALRMEARYLRRLADATANPVVKAEVDAYIEVLEGRIRQAENGDSESRYGKPPSTS